MNNYWKRLLTVFLCLSLVIGYLPFTAQAEEETDSIVESIIPETSVIEITEFSNGIWQHGYYENGAYVDEDWWYYSFEGLFDDYVFTITFNNGDEPITGTRWDILDTTGEFIDYTLGDQKHNPWKVGDYSVTVSYLGASTVIPVHIVPSPVESITVEFNVNEIYENENGQWVHGYVDANGKYVDEDWFCYSVGTLIDECSYTITYKNGNEPITGSRWEIRDMTGILIQYDDDQNTNPWKTGEHSVRVSYLGATYRIPVYIVHNPVVSITAETSIIEVPEYTNGHWDCSPDVDREFYYYEGIDSDYYSDLLYTITYDNGDEPITGTRREIYELTGKWITFSDDQWNTPWGRGDHKVTISYEGVSSEITFSITEGPIESITSDIPSFDITEKTNGYWEHGYYDANNDYIDEDWWHYDVESLLNGCLFTISYNNGDEPITGYRWDIQNMTGVSPEYDDDQMDNPWTPGEHSVSVSYLGTTCTIPVHIIPNPVESITAQTPTIEVVEYTNGFWDCGYYDKNGEFIDGNYFHYDSICSYLYSNLCYMITYNNGDEPITGTREEIYELTGKWIESYDNQSDGPWGIGEHRATISYEGVSSEITFSIVESPIESITVSPNPVQVVENSHGITMYGYTDSEGNYVDEEWYFYSADELLLYHDPLVFTINYNDGRESISGTRFEIYDLTGLEFQILDRYQNGPWEIGEHPVMIYYPGYVGEVLLEVIPSPVQSITINEPVKVVKDYSGYKPTSYDENGEPIEEGWFKYRYTDPLYSSRYIFTITFNNGDDPISGTMSEIFESTNEMIEFIGDDQSKNTPWDLGLHKATISYQGVAAEIDIEVIESPVESVVAEPLQIYENTHGDYSGTYTDVNGNTIEQEWFYYNFDSSKDITMTIHYNNGEPSFTGTGEEIFQKTGEAALVRDNTENAQFVYSDEDHWYNNIWGLGLHYMTGSYMGVTFQVPIEILASPIESVEAEDTWINEHLYVGAGTQYTYFNPEDASPDIIVHLTEAYGNESISGSFKDVREELGKRFGTILGNGCKVYIPDHHNLSLGKDFDGIVDIAGKRANFIVHTEGNHIFTHHEHQEPDYEHDGNIEYYECETCGRCYTDDEGQHQIRQEEIVLPRLDAEILEQPEDLTVDAGTMAAFSIVAEGQEPAYTWQVSKDGGTTWKNVNQTKYPSAATAELSFNAPFTLDGYQYRCVVSFADGTEMTSEAATLTVKTQSAILVHPVDAEVVVGDSAAFTTQVNGEVKSYKWQVSKDGGSTWTNVSQTKYPSAKTETLSFTAVEKVNGFMYRCVVTFTDGAVLTTDQAVLTVAEKTEITSHPSNTTVDEGKAATFAVAASGKVVSYAWQVSKNGGTSWTNVNQTKYPSAKTDELSFAAAARLNGYEYRCVVTFEDGTVLTSEKAVLTVKIASSPAITKHPADLSVETGKTAEFTVAASGEVTSYTWQVSKDNGSTWKNVSQSKYPSAKTAALSFAAVTKVDGFQYRCVVTFADGQTLTSEAATLSLK